MLVILFPITVGAIWGCTNVLMKYSKTNLQFIFYLLLNQCGSVLFVWGLSNLSKMVLPLANAVTLMVSALLAFCFCDERIGKSGFIGLILLCIGVFLLSGASLSPARRLKNTRNPL
ncbi:hypothetical protein PHET_09988 [Paragonimus heterotremus]|uniref:Transmembrane protein 234 n=1 Tax=Paragonimus heterotremus TaxID=100268 RepID=A0A8J4WD47_9TREM|nr:hypothetical protein PHET_09988 [Paragonimus heterotremus]